MESVSNTEFKNLIKDLRIERFCSNELLISNDLNEDFYFYFSIEKDSITDSGRIGLTSEQYEKICKLVSEFIEANPTEDNYAFSNIVDHYHEYGVNRNMFI